MNYDPLVEVNIAVYNHAPFLRETLESVLCQVTTFPFQVLIGDDCSTDGSIEILREYEKKWPDLIKVIYHPKNIGLNSTERNGIILLKKSTAKYIALLDGDDCWNDSLKLQKQIDFLESNLDYSLTFHRVYEFEEGKNRHLSDFNMKNEDFTFTINDLATGNFIHTPSVVFRNIFRDGLPDWFGESPVGDYLMYMLIAEHGKIKYFPEPMAIYRKNVGIWSGQSQLVMWEKWLVVLDLLMDHFRSHEVFQVLKEQKAKIITEVFSITRYLEKTVELLKADPQEIAKKVRLSTLLTAIKLKAKNKFMRSDRKKGVNL